MNQSRIEVRESLTSARLILPPARHYRLIAREPSVTLLRLAPISRRITRLLRLWLPVPKFKRVAVTGKLGGGHEERLGDIDRHQHVEPARRTLHDAELM